MKDQPDFNDIRSSVYSRLSDVASALASPVRLKIVQLLAQSPRSVEALSEQIQESMANTSQHLQKLARVGIVECRKEGTTRIYRVGSPGVLGLWESLQDLGHELDVVVQKAENELVEPDLCTELSATEVLKRVRSGRAILVDVRAIEEAEASPVPRALQIPAASLLKNKSQLAKDKTVFLFCRGRYCSLANPVVTSLRRAGYEAFRLKDSPFRLTQATSAL